MSDSSGPTAELPEPHVRFQYDLRTMLALTALVAWLCGWAGSSGIPILVALAALALIEGGCTQGTNLLGVLVRNLFAYFVVSLVFALVGFGLMRGENPTGWFGTTLFLYSPLDLEKSPTEEAIVEIETPPELLVAPGEGAPIGPDVVLIDPSDDVPDPFAESSADAEGTFVDPFATDPEDPFAEDVPDPFAEDEATDSSEGDEDDPFGGTSAAGNTVPIPPDADPFGDDPFGDGEGGPVDAENSVSGIRWSSLPGKAADLFRTSVDPFFGLEGVRTLDELLFSTSVLWCVIALVIAHRALAGRSRLTGYVLFWSVAAGLVYPLLGSWTFGPFQCGWLGRLGFASNRTFPLLPALWVSAWAALAGLLIFGRKSRPAGRCQALHSPQSSQVIVSIGLGSLCVLLGIVPSVYWVLQIRNDPFAGGNPLIHFAFTPLATVLAGMFGAFSASLAWLKRLHLPIILGGALTGLLAGMSLTMQLSPLCGLLLGLVGGLGMVGVAWILDALRVEDPGGAIAVCGTAGVWGTISWGIFVKSPVAIVRPVLGDSGVYFDDKQVVLQLLGIAVSFVWVFGVSAVVFLAIRRIPWLLKRENPLLETSGESEGASDRM